MGNEPKEPEIKLFVTEGCPHCEHIKDIVATGRFNQASVDLISLNSPEGKSYLEKLPIDRVPVAMKGSQLCDLVLTSDQDGEMLLINCEEEDKPDAEG